MTDFYYRLNQSHINLDNTVYIQKTTDIMHQYLRFQKEKTNLLVIGAGNLSDFDLTYFCSEFERVYLTDIDTKSVNEALGGYSSRPEINVEQIDYTGVSDTNFYDDFEKLLTFTHYSQVEGFFEKKMKRLNDFRLSSKFNQTFDSIYISPIYTQLFYREVETNLNYLVDKGFSRVFKDKMLSELLQSMTEIIDQFNKEIVTLLNANGTLFVASDIFYLKNDSYSQTIKDAINNDDRMNALHHEYQKQYGHGLGDYGLESLSEKLHTLESTWLLWGKNKNHAYAVKFNILKQDK